MVVVEVTLEAGPEGRREVLPVADAIEDPLSAPDPDLLK